MHILDEELFQAAMALAACPTAPCHEHHVLSYLEEKLTSLPNVSIHRDEFGNLHAQYEHDAAGREPVRLVAHMDHPAFVIDRTNTLGDLHFAGGVHEKYFHGKKITFHNEKSRRSLGKATIVATKFEGESKPVVVDRPIPSSATFAVWDLPAARCTKQLFISPACDDLAQVATVVALVRRLALSHAKASVHALFTRAEEIGFAGTFAALQGKTPLPPIATISLETSRAFGFAKVGAGPIVRVGDRLSIFDSRTTNWLETAFRDKSLELPEAPYQRLLMGGGTCEASVFHRAGFPTGALCVALNNYHNMGPGNSIRSESISLKDWQGLYDFLFFLATRSCSLQAADLAVASRFSSLAESGLIALKNHPI